jgi:molybdate/tungstate transport system substrate-binding protein
MARPATRRGVLASLAGGAAALAGCGGGGAGRSGGDTGDAAGGSRDDPVSVLGAGSLQRLLETGLRTAVDVPVRTEAHGSVAAARLVADGRRDPDVVALADPALFGSVLAADWHARFATNEVALAYVEGTPAAARLRAADRWFEPLVAGDVSLGRTDPALDPLGYRTLFVCRLAERYYDRPGLADAVLAPEQTRPETGLLAALEAGEVGAAFAYRSMAVDRGLATVDLPAEIDLGDPAMADRYRRVSYDVPDGPTVRGAPVTYAATLRTVTPGSRAVLDALASPALLAEFGFASRDDYPRYVGAVPEAVEG